MPRILMPEIVQPPPAMQSDPIPPRARMAVTVEQNLDSVSQSIEDTLAVEEPLEIQLTYGPNHARRTKSISVTMRTPGNDFHLAAGFLMTEGVVREGDDITRIDYTSPDLTAPVPVEGAVLSPNSLDNIVRVELDPLVSVSVANLERNFYTTSSCGVCGKASLLALQTIAPPRTHNSFTLPVGKIQMLPQELRRVQTLYQQTGGVHGAGLFDRDGTLHAASEDVGRHNAVDKLLGGEFLAGRLPLRERLLMLSGRASFELLQKALMAGIPMVVAVGAPSSLAVQVARQFDITLLGFLRDNRFNVYHGAERIIKSDVAAGRNRIP